MNQPTTATVEQNSKISNIKQKIFTGAFWTLVGFGGTQVIKFASTLILAKMLAPSDYGLISIVTVALIGINMVSDLGLGPNVMQNKRGEESDFLHSIWTVQALKGFLVWIFCVLLAWPISVFYDQPILLPVMIAVTFTSVISGLNSSTLYLTDKRIDLKKQILFQVASQLVSFLVMVAIAYQYPSVWVLVIGSIVTNSMFAYLTYKLIPIKMKWRWDPETNKQILSFGKWVAVSSSMGFMVTHSSPLILGKFLTMTSLGLYNIGLTLARVVEMVFITLIQKIVTPVMAQIRDESNASVRKKVTKLKLSIMAIFLPAFWVLVIFAPQIIDLIFDPRYKGAAWIMQTYCIAFIPMIISALGPFYLVLGDNKLLANLTFYKTITYVVLVFLGWHFNKGNGIIVGVCLYNTFAYFIELYSQIKYKVWLPYIDLLGFIVSALVLWFGLTITGNDALLMAQITAPN